MAGTFQAVIRREGSRRRLGAVAIWRPARPRDAVGAPRARRLRDDVRTQRHQRDSLRERIAALISSFLTTRVVSSLLRVGNAHRRAIDSVEREPKPACAFVSHFAGVSPR
jgi:hypothetical protein